MGFEQTVARDYRVVDVVQTVTFTAARESGSTSYTVTHASGADLTHEEVSASGGLFQHGDRRWLLGADQITVAAHRPQAGDRIVEAGGTGWRVQSAVLDAFGVSWDCVCRRER